MSDDTERRQLHATRSAVIHVSTFSHLQDVLQQQDALAKLHIGVVSLGTVYPADHVRAGIRWYDHQADGIRIPWGGDGFWIWTDQHDGYPMVGKFNPTQYALGQHGFDPDCGWPLDLAVRWRIQFYPLSVSLPHVVEWCNVMEEQAAELLNPYEKDGQYPLALATVSDFNGDVLRLLRYRRDRLLRDKPRSSSSEDLGANDHRRRRKDHLVIEADNEGADYILDQKRHHLALLREHYPHLRVEPQAPPDSRRRGRRRKYPEALAYALELKAEGSGDRVIFRKCKERFGDKIPKEFTSFMRRVYEEQARRDENDD